MWLGTVQSVLNGRPAQIHFKELETALLAMPEKRLIEGVLSDGKATCAIGEMAVRRRVLAGEQRQDVLAAIAEHPDDSFDFETAEFAKQQLGMSFTLGWLISEANDETFGGQSPESRWDSMLRWARRHIRPKES